MALATVIYSGRGSNLTSTTHTIDHRYLVRDPRDQLPDKYTREIDSTDWTIKYLETNLLLLAHCLITLNHVYASHVPDVVVVQCGQVE